MRQVGAWVASLRVATAARCHNSGRRAYPALPVRRQAVRHRLV